MEDANTTVVCNATVWYFGQYPNSLSYQALDEKIDGKYEATAKRQLA